MPSTDLPFFLSEKEFFFGSRHSGIAFNGGSRIGRLR
jgi:hypothetical protein